MRNIILLLFCLGVCLAQAQVSVIRNGKLSGALDGNGQDIHTVDQLRIGAPSGGTGRVIVLPSGNPTTIADGIQLGPDVYIYRSAAGALTIEGDLTINGTIAGDGGLGVLGANQTWSGQNTFTGTTTFALSPVLQQGLSVANSSVRTQIQTELLLRPGTDVQAYSARLASLAAAVPGDDYFLVGDGTGWVSVPQADLRNTIGLGALSNPTFAGLTLTSALTVPNGGSGLNSIAADQIMYGTGANTMGLTALTAAARTLLDDTSVGDMRTTLGLSLPLAVTSGGLGITAIAADQIPYGTGANTYGVTSLTSAARSLLDDTDAATMRNTLGVGAAQTVVFGALQPASPVGTAYGGTGLDLSAVAADKMLYSSATGVLGTTDLTSTARTLLDDSSTAAMRTTLGIDTDDTVQFGALQLTTPLGAAYGGTGVDVNGVTTGHVLYANGSSYGTFATTAFSRSVMAAADASAFLAAVSLSYPVTPAQGGTGLTSAPTSGQILLGNGSSGYTLTNTGAAGIAVLQSATAAQVRTAISLASTSDVTFNSLALTNPLGGASGGLGFAVGAADLIPFSTAANTWSSTPLTTFVRTGILEKSAPGPIRDTLELGDTDSVAFGALTLNNFPLDSTSGGTGVDITDAWDSYTVLTGSSVWKLLPMDRNRFDFTGSTLDLAAINYAVNPEASTASVFRFGSSAAANCTVTLPSDSDVYTEGTETTVNIPRAWDGRIITFMNDTTDKTLTILRQRSGSTVLHSSTGGELSYNIVIPPGASLTLQFRTKPVTAGDWYVMNIGDADAIIGSSSTTTFASAVDLSLVLLRQREIHLLDDGAANSPSGTTVITVPDPANAGIPVGAVRTILVYDSSWSGTVRLNFGGAGSVFFPTSLTIGGAGSTLYYGSNQSSGTQSDITGYSNRPLRIRLTKIRNGASTSMWSVEATYM